MKRPATNGASSGAAAAAADQSRLENGNARPALFHSQAQAAPGRAPLPLDSVSAHDLADQELEWFAKGWLSFGSFCLLGGASKAGKSTIAAARAAAFTGRGLKVPGQLPRRKGNVLWFTAEENPNTVTRPRLKLCGADLRRVFFPGRRRNGSVEHKLSLPDDLPWLEALVCRHKARYVVLDVLSSFVNPKKVNLMEEQPSRWLSEELGALGERTRSIVEGIRHCRKGTDGTQVDHFLGSGAIAAVARHVAAVKRIAGPGAFRALILTASNYGTDIPVSLFTLKGPEHIGKPVWRGETDAEDQRLQGGVDEKESAIERSTVEGYIRAELADGQEHEAKPVLEHCARVFKVSPQTVYRRAQAIGVSSRLKGKGEERVSFWRLPRRG